MIPTEHEYTVATHAAAEAAYERYRRTHPEVTLPPWSEVPPHPLQHTFLENVLPIVDAAISAVPDRAAPAYRAGMENAYDIHPGDPMPDEWVDSQAEEYVRGLTK